MKLESVRHRVKDGQMRDTRSQVVTSASLPLLAVQSNTQVWSTTKTVIYVWISCTNTFLIMKPSQQRSQNLVQR